MCMCIDIPGRIDNSVALTVVIFGWWEYGIFLILLICILNSLQCTCAAFIIKVYFYLKKKTKAIGFEITCREVIVRGENAPHNQALGKRRESLYRLKLLTLVLRHVGWLPGLSNWKGELPSPEKTGWSRFGGRSGAVQFWTHLRCLLGIQVEM